MIICESEFDLEDKNNKGYSWVEIDYYAWIPASFTDKDPKDRNHRLTLRKNLKTNKYELIKVFMTRWSGLVNVGGNIGAMVTNKPTEEIEVHFAHDDLSVVVEEGNGLWNYYHGSDDYIREPDVVCDHKYPNRSMDCKRNYREE